MKISLLILTYNNEDFIENCLKSVFGWAEEIIVIDAGSRDKTLAICRQYKARVYFHDWPGFSAQRDYAAKKAKNHWLFYLDADERIRRSLKKEIDKLEPGEEPAAFSVKRENYILGKLLKKGGWYPDRQIRLINKKKLLNWQGKLHEHPQVKGQVRKLNGSLIHLTHRGVNWCLKKTIEYTDHEALLRFQANHPQVKWWHFLTATFREFWYRGIIKGGLFEGLEGFMAVFYQVFNVFIIYFKLWELQQKKPMKEIYKAIDESLFKEKKY
jgi:glycosyltransferase involved in cell wall biosynthesis